MEHTKISLNDILLRKASFSDIELVINYRIMFLREVQGIPLEKTETALRKSLYEYLNKSFKDDSFVSWLADYQGNTIGFSGMVIREQPGNFEIPNGKTGYILNMFTLKEYRGLGIGSFLFKRLLEEAKSRNLDKVELHATKDGEPIYRRYGFIEPHDIALEHIL